MTSEVSARGFVLQSTQRREAGRSSVWLYGRLESGDTFLVRDGRLRPGFYLPSAQLAQARALGSQPLPETGQVDLWQRPVARVEFADHDVAERQRARLEAAGLVCHEADLRLPARYLIEHGLRGAVHLRGRAHHAPGVGLVFDEPELLPDEWTPTLSVLSLDIETDPAARRLLSIALHGCGAQEVLLLTPPGWTCPPGARPYASEPELLEAFCARVRALDPDVLTGWNVIDFDLRVLQRMAARLGQRFEFGRGAGRLMLHGGASRWVSARASVPGRVVLDGLALVRGAFLRFEEYGLDFVARQVLGEGKHLSGAQRADEILRLFRHDRPAFVAYNLADARLAADIVGRLQLVELAVARSRLTGLPLERVSASIAAFDSLYLVELHARGVVAPSLARDARLSEPTGGGHVLEPVPGLHDNVIVLDFRSLYPSLMRTFQIDPLNLVRAGTPPEPDAIVAPNGARFRRSPAPLAQILARLMAERRAAQSAGDSIKSQAIKILMNSFYGVLGTPACRFYDAQLANAITAFGRTLLLWSRDVIETSGRRVLYGDTDSLFVASGLADPSEAQRAGRALAAMLQRALSEHIARTWRVESQLEPQFERLYRRLLLPSMRHTDLGARKRYVGLIDTPRGPEVVFVGMEAVRGDWTELARRAQRELYARLFSGQPVSDYLSTLLGELRAGRLDEQLVYRKRLRKALVDYTATTPPHVAAARKLALPTRGPVTYVMTLAGPEPTRARTSRLDHEHYVQKQLRPIAEPVLALLGLDFDDLSGAARQLRLF